MATNKKPNKHKPGIPPLMKAKIESEFRKENLAARTAGVEYGLLATKIASLMILYSWSKTENPFEDYVKELNNCRDIIFEKKPIREMIDILREKGYEVSDEELIKLDPSLAQYF